MRALGSRAALTLFLLVTGCGDVMENEFAPQAQRSLRVDPGSGDLGFRQLKSDHAGKTLRLVSYTAHPPNNVLRVYRELTQATVHPKPVQNYAALREILLAGEFDVALVPDELLAMLVDGGRALPLDSGAIPILNYFRSRPGTIGLRDFPEIDPKFEFSVPYFIGRSGIAFDSALFENMYSYSWKDFLDMQNTFPHLGHVLEGKVDLAVDHRIAMALALRAGEAPVNSGIPREISAAGQRLMKLNQFVGNLDPHRFVDRIAKREAIIGICWEDHARHAVRLNANIRFVIPRDGSIAYLDSFVINRHTRDPALAKHLVRYLTDPEIAAQVSNHTLSRTVIPGTKPYLAADQVSDAGFLPLGDNSMDYYLHAVDENTERSYQWFWRTFTNANAGNLPAAGLDVFVSATTNNLLGQPADIHLHLANTGREALSGLSVNMKDHPEWRMALLKSGQIESLHTQVHGSRAGTTTIEIRIRDDSGVVIDRNLELHWQGIPSFEFTLLGKRNPIVVGQTNEYTLTLLNVGQGADRISKTRLEFPLWLQPLTINGATAGAITNWGGLHRILLEDIAELLPDDSATWTIAAVARTNGTAVIHAEAGTSITGSDSLRARTTTKVF